MTVLPSLAISSQNWTMSGNWGWERWSHYHTLLIVIVNTYKLSLINPNDPIVLSSFLNRSQSISWCGMCRLPVFDVCVCMLGRKKDFIGKCINHNRWLCANWPVVGSNSIPVISVIFGVLHHEAGVVGNLEAPHATY